MNKTEKRNSRRSFLKNAASGTTELAVAPTILSSKEGQKKLLKRGKQKFSKIDQIQTAVIGSVEIGVSDSKATISIPVVIVTYLNGLRNETPVIEDAIFGYPATAPALLCNHNYFNNRIIDWDPVNMKLA